MLADGAERDVARHHELVVTLVVGERRQPQRPRVEQLRVRAGHPGRSLPQVLGVHLDPQGLQEVARGPLRRVQVDTGGLARDLQRGVGARHGCPAPIVTQQYPGEGSSAGRARGTSRPPTSPSISPRFIPQTMFRCAATSWWNGQLRIRMVPASSRRGSYPCAASVVSRSSVPCDRNRLPSSAPSRRAASRSTTRLLPLASASTAWASSRAASSYSRGGTLTANSRSDRA